MDVITNRKRKFQRRLNLLQALSNRKPKLSGWYRKGGSRGYVTIFPVDWGVGGKTSQWRHYIPAGFEFESSVPKCLQWLLSPDHPYFLFPAAVHDSLIEQGYTRPLCDGEWLSAARFVGAPKYLRELAYIAIRLKQLVRWLIKNEVT